MPRSLKVVIIGGGIGGLTLAAALRQRGIEAAIYEKSSALREVGAGLQLGPNGVKVLNALGLGESLARVAHEPPDLVSVNWNDGGLRHRAPLGSGAEARFGAKYLMVHRADLHDLLVARVADTSINLGESFAGLAQGETSAAVRLESGREIEADVVIGADGIRSPVRQELFGADQARFTGAIGWRALLPMEQVPDSVGPDGVSLRRDFVGFLGPRGHVIMYPIRAGTVLNFFAGYNTDEWAEESWTKPSTPAEMMAAYAGWSDDLLAMMRNVEHCFTWGLYDRDPLAAWTRGRVTLLGDAAHPMMPTLAQGASITLEDAFALARHLDAGREDPVRALAAYEDERRPRATRVQLQARQQYLNNKMSPAPPPMSRDWIFAHDATRPQPSGYGSPT